LVGFGTERLEEEVRRQFPSARVLRKDRDEAGLRSTGNLQSEAVTVRSWDILIGTKRILHEPAARGCALLGLPFADAGLHVPDFRAAERTYHGLLDVLALVDGQAGARVILQTFLPHHHVIRALAEGRPDLFTSVEMELRKALGYPPFASLIVLQVSGGDEPVVHRAIDQWAALLQQEIDKKDGTGSGREATPRIHVLGPVPAPVVRLRGQYRWRILVKAAMGSDARGLILRTVEDLSRRVKQKTLKLEVDVDPVDLA
jgi:primosomal protein N' (replication factor Y)